MSIRKLPDHIINRIAAGEVIERPASVIKELVDNAIDANASKIKIILEDGGKSSIKIIDNGSGMVRDDLEKCLERHATSKLTDEHLVNITTMGFRGEALPSIASISQLKIISRHKTEPNAWQISMSGAEKSAIVPESGTIGTTVIVENLFFNVPARLKFLKAASSEMRKITESLEHLALAKPEIHFETTHNNRRMHNWNVNPENALNHRIIQILGTDFYDNSIAFNHFEGSTRLSGRCSLPTYNHATQAEIYLFVNNRPVRDRLLQTAVRVAYQDFLPRDRHPSVLLSVNCDPFDVDINAHPAKVEVRFRDSSTLRHQIIATLRAALQTDGTRVSNTIIGGFVNKINKSSQINELYQQHSKDYSNYKQPSLNEATYDTYNTGPRTFGSNITPTIINKKPELPNNNNIIPTMGHAIGQIFDTYIIAQTADGLILVDQHAAHERLIYESMKNGQMNDLASQALLVPIFLTTDEETIIILQQWQNILSKQGIIIRITSENTVVLEAVPTFLLSCDLQKILRDLADELREQNNPTTVHEKIHEICGNIACRNSIKAGRRLKIEEMNALLRHMEATKNSGQCNHGRPTYIRLKQGDLERLFGR